MTLQWISRLVLVAFVGAVCSDVGQLRALEPDVPSTEIRTYDVLVDGKNSGQSTLTITRYSDGTETVGTDAKITVVWTVFSYVYEFHGQEQWRGGHLEKLNSRAVDGGRKLSLSVVRIDEGFRITRSEGKPATAPDIQLTTNYWRQPTIDPSGRAITLLDADTGKLYEEKVEQTGQEDFTLAGQRVAVTGYRLKGKLDVHLWFDAQGLLVRQASKEDGHPTELRLVSIQQPALPQRGIER